jgi:hypothetical protein
MGNTVQSIIGLVRPAQRAGWAVFLASLLPLGCGGRSQDAGANGGGTPGGAAEGGEGGAGSTSLGGSGVGGNDSIITFAGAPPAAGAAGASNVCDENTLWPEITDGSLGGLGHCEPAPIPTPNEQTGLTRGVVIINADGLVIENTGLDSDKKKRWLDGLSNKRWTCLAGQTIGYKCSVAH